MEGIGKDDIQKYEEPVEQRSFGGEEKLPPWTEQLTVRGLVTSLIIGSVYSIIVMKLNLTTGLVPTLNVSAALLSFVFLKSWTKLLHRAGIVTTPFTKQEVTVAQTCAVACYTIAVGAGFGSYLLGLNKKTYELSGGAETAGNTPGSYRDPGFGWITGFLFVSTFVGLAILVPLRKVLILDDKLTYPSGTATAVLINGFYTAHGDRLARQQVKGFAKFFSVSFIWSFFQWFFAGGDACGFIQFPTFGLKAWRNTFFFDFSMTYVGAGMLVSHLVNFSLMVGAILSWGIMWPLIRNLKGDWYPAKLSEGSMKSLGGYKVFIPIALILGDGLYSFIKVLIRTFAAIYKGRRGISAKVAPNEEQVPLEVAQRNEVFHKESIPNWIAYVTYVAFGVGAIIAIPLMFKEMKWYYVVIAYLLSPILGYCNAYGTGLTDMNMAYNYGKAALFILAAVAGEDNGVVAGLIGCGLIKAVVYMAADLMHDFKTGYLTKTSPRSMLLSQVVGTVMGCIVAPASFFLFYKAFDVGNPNGAFKAPYALVYRNMAILGVEGFSALPKNCLQLCYGFFAFAMLSNVTRDLVPEKYGKWIPLPMVMAVPFLVGANFAIDMCLGSVVVFAWNWVNSDEAKLMVPAVASGLMCGDGLWTLPSAVLALAKVKPPICMKFVSA
ncbi:metal-nicotianamine transporter YSL3-like [Wolffia australiana]